MTGVVIGRGNLDIDTEERPREGIGSRHSSRGQEGRPPKRPEL